MSLLSNQIMEKKKIPTICLNMIVKNESKIICRLLETVLPIIDTYCICDTGSTDMTRELIKEFFDIRCIKGKIINEPFKNFGYNRTVALNAAKDMADYLLFLDADMKLEIDPKFDKSNLTADVYQVIQGSNNFKYYNMRLIRSSLNFSCIGSTHEYYDIKGSYTTERLHLLGINDIGDGQSKKDKFERDIRLLKDDLKENPNNARTYFYLANSYRDTGKFDKAIEYFKKRISFGGWIDEIWNSKYELGKCYMKLGKEADAIQIWLEAYEYNPKRAENLYELVKYYRIKSKNKLAYMFYRWAKQIPYPTDSSLFIHKDVYDYLLDYEFSIIAYYIDRNIEMQPIFMKLMNIDPSRWFQIEGSTNLLANYKFYVKSLDDYKIQEFLLDSYKEIAEEKKKSFQASTPSIISHGDNYIVNVRMVDYYIHPDGSYDCPDGYSVNTKNIGLVMDKEFNIIQCRKFLPNFNNACRIRGLEDVKIINYGEKIRYISTKQSDKTEDYVLTMAGGIYDLTKDKLEYNESISPIKAKCEKNWALFLHNDKLKVIYKWYPLTIYDSINMGKLGKKQEKEMPYFFKYARGSTNGVIYKNELWFICHRVEYSDPRNYYHFFVILDKDTLELKKYSYLFKFELTENIEYSLGLIVEDERIIVSYSTWDRNSKLKIYHKKQILKEMFV